MPWLFQFSNESQVKTGENFITRFGNRFDLLFLHWVVSLFFKFGYFRASALNVSYIPRVYSLKIEIVT